MDTMPAARKPRYLYWLAGLIVVCILFVVAAAALAYALFDEAVLRAEAEKALGRKIAYTRISPGLFAFHVENLVIGDTAGFAADDLLSARSIALDYSWISLFSGKLRIREVRIEDAALALEVDSAGHTNVDDLIKPREGEGMLAIESLRIDSAVLRLASPWIATEVPVKKLSAGGLDGDDPFFQTDILLFDKPLALQGKLQGKSSRVQLAVKTEDLPLASLKIPASVFVASGLTLGCDLKADVGAESGAFSGNLALGKECTLRPDLVVTWSDTPAAFGSLTATMDAAFLSRIAAARSALSPLAATGLIEATVKLNGPLARMPQSVTGKLLGFGIKPPGFAARIENARGGFSMTPSTLNLQNVTLTILGNPLTVDGSFGFNGNTLDLGVKGDPVDFGLITRLLTSSPLPSGMSLAGKGGLDLRLKGPATKPTISGTVRLDGLQLASASPRVTLTNIKGNLRMDGDQVTLAPLSANLQSSALHAEGTYAIAADRFNVDIKADPINLTELPSALDVKSLDIAGTGSFTGKLTGSLARPQVAGMVRSPSFQLSGVTFTDFTGQLLYTTDKLSVTSFEARVLGGRLTGKADVEVSKPTLDFDATVNAASLELPATLAALTGYQGATAGSISVASLSLAGQGANIKSYNGFGSATLKSPGFGAIPALTKLAPFLGLSADGISSFNEGTASVRITNGVAQTTKPLRFTSSKLGLTASGSIGLDGALNLDCTADAPSASLAGQIGGTAIGQIMGLKQSGGRTSIPFALGGTLTAPAPRLNIKPEQAIMGILQDRLGGRSSSPAAEEGDTASDAVTTTTTVPATREERILNAIDGLLRRK